MKLCRDELLFEPTGELNLPVAPQVSGLWSELVAQLLATLPVSCSSSVKMRLTSHADVADLAAWVFLGVERGQAPELVSADLHHGPQRQIHRLRVDHLQDDVLRVVEGQRAVVLLRAGQEAVVGSVQKRQPSFAEGVSFGAVWRQDQDHGVVRRVHAVKIPEVEVGVLVEEPACLDL